MPGYGHNIWTNVAMREDVLTWLFAQSRADAAGRFTLPEDLHPTKIQMTVGSLTARKNGAEETLDAAPVIREGRTMLPVRFGRRKSRRDRRMGRRVLHSDDFRRRRRDQNHNRAAAATVNGVERALDAPAFIENSRTYLPVRFVAEALGAYVEWDGASSIATITK